MTPSEVGINGRVRIKDDMTLLIRRMNADQTGVYLERNNNMFLWMDETKELYYQNPLGEKFRVLFEPLNNNQ